MSYACPACKEETQVIDTREISAIFLTGEHGLRRRRRCLNLLCKKRFTTYELTAEGAKNFRRNIVARVGTQLTHIAERMIANGTLE